jgi:hypothetical protein
MTVLRISGVLIGLVLLSGCMSRSQMPDDLKLSGPCAPNYVSLALQF